MTPATATVLAIPLAKIHESPDNPRKHFDAAFVTRIAQSLTEIGQLTPATVRPHPKKTGEYELAAGATRLRAAKQAKLATLDCHVRALTDQQFLELLTFENLERKDLRPLEEARGYELLMKRLEGFTPEVIAKRQGVSVDYVRDRVRLLRLTPAAVKLLEDEEIELGHALELAKLSAADQVKAIKDGLFEGADQQRSAMLKLGDQPKRKPVTVVELRAWVDDNLRADVSHPDLPDLYPKTAAVLAKGKAEKIPQVFIILGHVRDEIRRGGEVLTPANWRRADGEERSKTCDRPKKIGIVAGGDAARNQAFLICTSKVCPVHFPDHVRRAKQKAAGEAKAAKKGKPAPSYAEQEKIRRDREAKEEAARAARRKVLASLLPTIQEQILATVAKLSPAACLAALDAPIRSKSKEALVLRIPAKDVDGKLRRLYLRAVLEDAHAVFEPEDRWWFERSLTDLCKQFGIKLADMVAKATPAPEKPKVPTAPKKKAKKLKPSQAFMAPVQPDAVLAAIVGEAPLVRTELTKKLWAYIKQHGLQDKKNRRMINADEALLPVFGGKKAISMFDMTKAVGKHCKPAQYAKKGKPA